MESTFWSHTSPVAKATADPPDEPPADSFVSQGFSVLPNTLFTCEIFITYVIITEVLQFAASRSIISAGVQEVAAHAETHHFHPLSCSVGGPSPMN